MSLLRIEEAGAPIDAFADALDAFDDTESLARSMAAAASRLVRSTFSATRSPDGITWAQLARPRAGVGGALLLTGDLRDNASRAAVDPDGFVFVVEDAKGVHQHGSRRRNLPARPFYPDAGRLPVTWEQALDAAALRFFETRLP